MKILLIQSRKNPEMLAIEQEEYAIALGSDAALTPISSLDTRLPWETPQKLLEGFDAVAIGGSGEFDLDGGRPVDDPAQMTARDIEKRLTSLIEYILTHDVPTFGICFGHQLIGDIAGGKVKNDPTQKKIGTHDITVTNRTDPLFSSLPSPFAAQYGHKDSITELPRGAVIVAHAPKCSFSALRYGSHVYTTQFHPELTKADVIKRLEKTPGYLPEGVDTSSIVRESPEASTLLKRFIDSL